jgi:GxxExxY protein
MSMEFEELSEIVIGCAYTVYNKLGYGFLESVYEKAPCIELARAGLDVKAQIAIEVTYDGIVVGDYIADLLVNVVLLVELKSVSTLSKAHEVQLVNYLVATNKPVGPLINFGESGVQVRRKRRSYKKAIDPES